MIKSIDLGRSERYYRSLIPVWFSLPKWYHSCPPLQGARCGPGDIQILVGLIVVMKLWVQGSTALLDGPLHSTTGCIAEKQRYHLPDHIFTPYGIGSALLLISCRSSQLWLTLRCPSLGQESQWEQWVQGGLVLYRWLATIRPLFLREEQPR